MNIVGSGSKSNKDQLSSGEIRADLNAVGLNFKDVLNVLTPEEAAYVGVESIPGPGSDFAGLLTCIPSDANNDFSLRIGDRVLGMNFDMLRSHVNVPMSCLTRMPSNLSFEEAAQVSMVKLTVDYALGVQAKLNSSDRILIQAASGGVGLTAVQYAQQIGAEVFATASSAKHDFLRCFGVKNISTSRDSDTFLSEMKGMVGSSKVNVILNSLTSGNYI